MNALTRDIPLSKAIIDQYDTITVTRCEIGCELVFLNKKEITYRLSISTNMPTSMTLNDLERHNDRQRALSLRYGKRLNSRTLQLCYGSLHCCMDLCLSPDGMCFLVAEFNRTYRFIFV